MPSTKVLPPVLTCQYDLYLFVYDLNLSRRSEFDTGDGNGEGPWNVIFLPTDTADSPRTFH